MQIEEYVSLKEFTTFKIGGVARYFCSVDTEQNLKTAFLFAHEKRLPILVLGGGSNILISGSEINAVVLKIDIAGVAWHDEGGSVKAVAGAGENWDAFVAEAVQRGLWGIENLSGIPGTVGATPIQNIGAYGSEIRNTLESVEVFDTQTGAMKELLNEACRFAYRDSILKSAEGKRYIVTAVTFRFSKNGSPNLEYKDLRERFKSHLSSRMKEPTLCEIREAVLQIRGRKFPDLRTHGTAGSFFKNPIISKERFDELTQTYPDLPGYELRTKDGGLRIKVSLAWILDNVCKLKGYRKGNVSLFEKQPIVLVHSGGASAEEIESFAKEITERVKKQTGIDIEWEVQKI